MTSHRQQPQSLEHSVELLERSLGYTRGRLARARTTELTAQTPCADWSLGELLAHMDDALDAFLEASVGPVTPVGTRRTVSVAGVQDKACALLGAWTAVTRGGTATIAVGDRQVPSGLLVATAALEVAVHGWDVGRSTGEHAPLPAALASALQPVAATVVTDADREVRFAAARPVRRGAPPDHVLLAHLGRSPGPSGQI